MATAPTGVDVAIGSINQSSADQMKIAQATQAASAINTAANAMIGAAESQNRTSAAAAGAIRDGARAS